MADHHLGAAERASHGRQEQFKPKRSREAEADRRRAALKAQQSEARSSRINDVRRIAMEALLGDSEANDLEQQVEFEDDVDDDAVDGEAMIDEDSEVVDDVDMVLTSAQRRDRARKLRRLRRLHRTIFFARQLQVPDWMVEVPDDLSANWLVLVRPEGERCLLLSNDGRVEVRRKNGVRLDRYTDCRMPKGLTILEVVCIETWPDASNLNPNEAAVDVATAAGHAPAESVSVATERDADDQDVEDSAVVDMEMEAAPSGGGRGRHSGGRGGRGEGKAKGKGRGKGKGKGKSKGRQARPDRRYAVCDVLIWGDTDLVGADAECRMFWLDSRAAEFSENVPRKARTLQWISAKPATPETLCQAYRDDVGYPKDSLMFLHREGHYAMDQPITPLALMWRDRRLSRFVVDTPDEHGEKLPERQAIVLELRGNGYLRTADRLLVANISEEEIKAVVQDANKSKALLRCEVEGVDVEQQKLLGLKPVAYVAARSRVWADSWGRVLFQHMHRKDLAGAISFEAVVCAAVGKVVPAG
mmetsp:Transcript_1040/g.1651  ORF Transcript_1040/g.1651 Transcript_1040/m.1651 type:complete len:529 (-) Transcript_1040:128-1714(-)